SPEGIVGVSVRAPGAGGAKPQVVKCAHLQESQIDPASLGQLAKKIGNAKFPWILPLSRGDYKIFVVPQPPVDSSEMAQSVRWSLGPLLDFSVEEAAVDWMSIPSAQNPSRPAHIYVIAAHKDVVARHADAFKKTTLPLDA